MTAPTYPTIAELLQAGVDFITFERLASNDYWLVAYTGDDERFRWGPYEDAKKTRRVARQLARKLPPSVEPAPAEEEDRSDRFTSKVNGGVTYTPPAEPAGQRIPDDCPAQAFGLYRKLVHSGLDKNYEPYEKTQHTIVAQSTKLASAREIAKEQMFGAGQLMIVPWYSQGDWEAWEEAEIVWTSPRGLGYTQHR